MGQLPGTVVTELVGLDVAVLTSQLQRVKIDWAVPWVYVGRLVLQFIPLSTEYCKVEPVGQVPLGAAIIPPDGVPPKVAQVLLVTCTAGAWAVKTGQLGHVPGTVVTELVGLDVAVLTSQLQRVKIVWAVPWVYVGRVMLQFIPLSTEYCKVEPVGQVPLGAAIIPPDGDPPKVAQVLLVT